MRYQRKYIQFGELVIDGYDMLESADLSGGFKTQTREYSFTHGDYAVFKRPQQLSSSQTLSMTLKLDVRKLDCTLRDAYRDFVFEAFSTPGRLWAIQGGQLVWAWAFVDDFSEAYSYEKYYFNVDVDFVIYEGAWHKADAYKTFFKPFNVCAFLEDYYIRPDKCTHCCVCLPVHREECPACVADCDFLLKENALCATRDSLDVFYADCVDGYQILYNCMAANKLFEEEVLGDKLCHDESCDSIIAGQFYSDTVLETDGVTITLKGAALNPYITINGNTMQVMGEYMGTLILYPNGDIFYQEDECCPGIWISPDKLVIPENSTFGFTVHRGKNSVVIDTNECCILTCVYIKVDSISP